MPKGNFISLKAQQKRHTLRKIRIYILIPLKYLINHLNVKYLTMIKHEICSVFDLGRLIYPAYRLST